MEINESNLLFSFSSDYKVIKLDDTPFYRHCFNKMPGSKGVDIVADSDKVIHFMEIKNCLGHEIENRWRTSVDNSRLDSAPEGLDVDNRDSFDIEVAKKVAMSIDCLFGAWLKAQESDKATELEEYWKAIDNTKIQKGKKQVIVTLFLEGNFGNRGGTRDKKMIMQRIQESIRKKLAWINCKVLVVDSHTYNCKYYTVKN